MASKVFYDAKRMSEGNPSVYILNMTEIPMAKDSKIRKCVIGTEVAYQSQKVIMVVGATGAGKTSLINALVNYMQGVEWGDDFRFQLIADTEEVKKKSQADSQTEWITAYTFYPQRGQKLGYTLTVIDTPGFGDTRGIKRDKEITEQIRQFFTNPTVYGIDQLDAIAFVAQSSLPRLTATQKFVFDSVLSLFGKDIAENIFLFLTFADQQSPQILESVKKAQLPHKSYFKFNNSALYAQKGKQRDKTNENTSDTDEDEDEDDFNKKFWKMGKASFRKFFKELDSTKSKSITLTADVLEERKRLETYIAGIPQLIRSSLVKLEQLKKEQEFLKKCKSEMDSNENYTYTVNVEEVRKERVRDEYAMVCNKCEFTCHRPCAYYLPKFSCVAMKFFAVARGCGVCPQNCGLEHHEKVDFIYKKKTVEKTMTYSDIKKRYVDAKRKKYKAEELVENVRQDIEKAQAEYQEHVDGVKKSLARLQEIALKQNPLTTSEYINYLIQNEEAEAQSGWEERRKELLKIRDQAKLTEQIAQSPDKIDLKNMSLPKESISAQSNTPDSRNSIFVKMASLWKSQSE